MQGSKIIIALLLIVILAVAIFFGVVASKYGVSEGVSKITNKISENVEETFVGHTSCGKSIEFTKDNITKPQETILDALKIDENKSKEFTFSVFFGNSKQGAGTVIFKFLDSKGNIIFTDEVDPVKFDYTKPYKIYRKEIKMPAGSNDKFIVISNNNYTSSIDCSFIYKGRFEKNENSKDKDLKILTPAK